MVPAYIKNGYFFAIFGNSKIRENFLSLLQFPPEFILKADEKEVKFTDQTLCDQNYQVMFKNPKLGCDFCIFTYSILKNDGIGIPTVLTDMITDYHCYGGSAS
jgi:hypothetical protein